jgi:hypothetical protein
MLRCSQTESQNVLEHGFSVNHYFHDLISDRQLEWRVPDWYEKHREQLLSELHLLHVIDHYTIFHDCGKPYCLTLDERGQHFPNHAAQSQDIYLALTHNSTVSNLIGWDMVLHTCTSKGLDDYLNIWSPQDAATLLLVALSEIHSNAAMFGGIDSTSFKIKWKRLNKRGKQVCRYLFGGAA